MITGLQKDIDLNKKVLATIVDRERQLAVTINADSFIITAPNADMARQISQLVTDADADIRHSIFPCKSKNWSKNQKIKVIVSPTESNKPAAGFIEKINTDFDTQGKPFQYTVCVVEVAVKNGKISSLGDECRGSVRHELTHAFFENEVRARLGNKEGKLEIPAALHEGLATHMDSANMQSTLSGTLGWYPITKKKIPTAKEILSTEITSTDYGQYAYSYGLAEFLFSLDVTKEQSKYIDFTVKYLQTKNWDKAAQVYGFKNLDALDKDFKKWFQIEYSKSIHTPAFLRNGGK